MGAVSQHSCEGSAGPVGEKAELGVVKSERYGSHLGSGWLSGLLRGKSSQEQNPEAPAHCQSHALGERKILLYFGRDESSKAILGVLMGELSGLSRARSRPSGDSGAVWCSELGSWVLQSSADAPGASLRRSHCSGHGQPVSDLDTPEHGLWAPQRGS